MALARGNHRSRVWNVVLLVGMACTLRLLHAQELVPDPGFELINSCPDNVGFAQIWRAVHWYQLSPTPDLYHCGEGIPVNLFGVQQPFSGAGFAGSARGETMGTRLVQPMRAGRSYRVRFRCSLAEGYAPSGQLGILFSADSLCLYNRPWDPQVVHTGGALTDSAGWMEVSGLYLANGCERYLAVMDVDTADAYYYYDEVSVTCADPLGCDPIACVDTVDLNVPNVFTPNGDLYNERFTFRFVGEETLEYAFTIYDRWGDIVANGDQHTGLWDGTTERGPVSDGIYYYIVSARRKTCDPPVVRKGYVHVFR